MRPAALVREHRAFLLLVLIASGLRITHFLVRGALWGDEAALAINISPRSFSELTQPLVLFQVCPLGFLALAKLGTTLFGESERSLRLVSLCSGICVPPLVYLAAGRAIGRRTGLIALGLIAVLPWMIYYASELKPYATDAAMAAAAIALVALLLDTPDDRRLRAGLALLGLAGVAVSIPFIFVFAGGILALALDELERRRRFRRLLELTSTAAVVSSAFLLHLVRFLGRSTGAQSRSVNDFWEEGFFPFPPHNLAELRWLPGKFFYAFVEPGGFYARYLAGALFLFGLVVIGRRRRAFAAALVAPLLLLLIASALGRYPALARLILFTVPIMVIGIASALGWLWERSATTRGLAVAMGGLLLVQTFTQAPRLLIPSGAPDTADFARRLNVELRPTDGLFVDDDLEWSFKYYRWRYSLAVAPIDTSPSPPEYPKVVGTDQAYLHQLDPLFGKDRVWLVLSDFERPGRGASYDAFVTDYVERHGGRALERVRGNGVSLALYDLSR